MASDCAHGGCGRFSANGARGPARKTKDEGKAAGKDGGSCGDGRGNRSKRRDGTRGWEKQATQARSMKKRDTVREIAEGLRRKESCGETRERLGVFPERPARRKRRGAGKEVAGARGGGVDGNPLLPQPVRGFCDAPATRFRRSSPARHSRFSPSSSAVFRNAATVHRTLPVQGAHVHAPRFPQGRKPPPPPPPRARSSAFSSSFTFPHTSPRALPCAAPLAPARTPRSPRQQSTKKRAEFPPRVCSCGPDAAAVHRRIRTCIQNEARRASRS